MKKTKTTVIFAVICLLVSIVSFAVAGKCANGSKGIKQVERLISACEAHDPDRIEKCFDESTADPYTFSENISVEGFTASSSVRNDSAASSYAKTEDKRCPIVYITAEYTDKNGQDQTDTSAFYVIHDAGSGKIFSIEAFRDLTE